MRLSILISMFSILFSNVAIAGYYEACKISGVVKSISSEKGSKLTVEFQVVKSEPTVCLSSSHEPAVCKSYANKTYDIRLSKSFKDKLTIGTKLELVQEGIHDTKGVLRKAWSLPEECE